MTNNATLVTGLSHMYPDNRFIDSLRKTARDLPDTDWDDAFSRGQIRSKQWLVASLRRVMQDHPHISEWYPSRVYICASWYGILADMLMDEFGDNITRIRCFDIDPDAVLVANKLLRHWSDRWKVKSSVKDVHELNFVRDTFELVMEDGTIVERQDTPDTIINTSCEHIENFDEWYARIPDGKLVIMQSNDFFEHEQHVNCSPTLEAFASSTPMQEVLYSDSFGFTQYTRFMRIGRK